MQSEEVICFLQLKNHIMICTITDTLEITPRLTQVYTIQIPSLLTNQILKHQTINKQIRKLVNPCVSVCVNLYIEKFC